MSTASTTRQPRDNPLIKRLRRGKFEANAGVPNANSNQLSLSEIDAFRRHLGKCWNPPPGASSARRVVVPITIQLTMDRTLAKEPKVEMRATDPYSQVMIESAVRAIIQCQPYTMFSVERYETWKVLPIDFDPEMFGG